MKHTKWLFSVRTIGFALGLCLITLHATAQNDERDAKPRKIKVSTSSLLKGAIKRVQPAAPAHTRIKGIVKVKLTVSLDGEVISADVVSGHALLRAAALEAARQWKFKPSLIDGPPIIIEGILPFEFK